MFMEMEYSNKEKKIDNYSGSIFYFCVTSVLKVTLNRIQFFLALQFILFVLNLINGAFFSIVNCVDFAVIGYKVTTQ